MTAILLLFARAASAHQPHDPMDLVAVSPAFASDAFVLGTRYPDQNWRSLELAASTDGGATWASAITGLGNQADFTDLRLSPGFASDGVGLVTTAGEGAWRTADRGAHWTQTLPGTDLVAGAIAYDGGPIFLVADRAGALWRSADQGGTWAPVATPKPLAVVGMSAFGAELAVAGVDAVFRSTDAGLTWAALPVAAEVRDVSAATGIVVVATAGGGFASVDGGAFSALPAFPQALQAIAVSPAWPGDRTVVAAEAAAGPFVSEDGGETATPYALPTALSDQTEIHWYGVQFSGDYLADGTVFANLYEGLFASRDRGRTWTESDTRPPGVINALAISPSFPEDRTLLVASYDAGMWLSTDGGDSYAIRNDDLRLSSVYDADLARDATGALTAVLALNSQMYWGVAPFSGWDYDPLPAEAEYSSRVALSPDFAADGAALVGTRAHGIYRTDDAGATWLPVTEPMPAISALAWGPGDVVLAGTKSGGALRSVDGGRTFAAAPLPAVDEPVWIDVDPGGFLVGTGAGLYTSVDGAAFAAVPAVSGVIHQVACAPDGTRYAVVRGGDLYRADPGGGYAPIAPELTAGGSPYELEISPGFADDGTLFAAIEARLYRSTDRGDTWRQVGMSRVRYEEDAQALRNATNPSLLREEASVRGVMEIRLGSEATLQFDGVGAEVLGVTRADLGDADVVVDGAVVARISQTGAEAYQVVQFATGPLPAGLHTIALRPVSSAPFELDAIDVLVPVPPPAEDTGGTPGTTSDTGTPPGTEPSDEPPAASEGGSCGCSEIGARGKRSAVWLLWSFAVVGARRRHPR